jgi:hypothetical protein
VTSQANVPKDIFMVPTNEKGTANNKALQWQLNFIPAGRTWHNFRSAANWCFFAVPSVAPDDVRCAGLTSQSLQVSWQPPPTSQCNGVLQGYKLFYEPVLDDHWQGKVKLH